MASIAALQIYEGGLKSGSPALREMTSRPSRASSFAFAEIFRVSDGEICCANVEIIVFQFLKVKLPKWAILFYPAFIQFGTGSGCARGAIRQGGPERAPKLFRHKLSPKGRFNDEIGRASCIERRKYNGVQIAGQ